MKSILLIIHLLFFASLFSQNRLDFIKYDSLKICVEKSIRFLEKTSYVSEKIKKENVVFIAFDIDNIFENKKIDYLGITYSTRLPLQFAVLNNGQFETSPENNILYYNYSPNLVLIFSYLGDKLSAESFLDVARFKKESSKIKIQKNSLLEQEFFEYEKGNDFVADVVLNFFSLKNSYNGLVIDRVDTFDLKTFVETWYDIEIVKNNSYK